ncbi:unnamed protein product, partial [Nippostrongylus brasiliensis]|uniref:Mediator of RNA polymerase II transcription subunit 25 n=1 Tax=Nippostrongylus brasiliensis TaxID=27835 RepID=A0A0N4XSU6_NIPBR
AENGSDSEGEADDVEWSSETEKEREKEDLRVPPHNISKDSTGSPFTVEQSYAPASAPPVLLKMQTRVGSTCSAPLVASTSLGGISHSLTTGSISKKSDRSGTIVTEKGFGATEQLSTLLTNYPAVSASCWLCSYNDLPHLSTIAVPTVNCPSASVVKQAISQIVGKIQNFCNSNSSNPPVTWVGVIGGDKFVGQV